MTLSRKFVKNTHITLYSMNNINQGARILLIEDNEPLCQTIQRHFLSLGFDLQYILNGDQGHHFLMSNANNLDLVIIDINLPGMNGLDICHEARTNNIQVPILILTYETGSDTVVNAFDLGADDYVRKPFDGNELLARVNAILKKRSSIQNQFITTDNLKIDLNTRNVSVAGEEILLRRKEFDLLVFFSRHINKVLTRDQIIAGAWNFDDEPYPNTVDAHISVLRKKLLDDEQKILQTAYGVGYIFKG